MPTDTWQNGCCKKKRKQNSLRLLQLNSSLRCDYERVHRFTLDVTCCSQHNFKSPTNPTIAMPSKADSKDQGQREQGAKAWQSLGRP